VYRCAKTAWNKEKMKKKVLILSLLLLSVSAIGQDKQDLPIREGETLIGIKAFPSWISSPIEITAIKVKGEEVRAGKPFPARDNWIRHLTVTVKNVSKVDIVGVVVNVEFPYDSDDNPWLPEVELRMGNDYSFSRDLTPTEWILRAGESAELSVSKSGYTEHRRAMDARDVPVVVARRAEIRPEMAAFSEDRVWLRGRFLRRGTGPNKWLIDEAADKAAQSGLRRGNLLVKKVAFARPTDGCYTWYDVSLVVCTGTCPTCTAGQDDMRDATQGGWKRKSNAQCKQVVGGELVDCPGCTKLLYKMDYDHPC